MSDAQKLFRQHFGFTPTATVRAPGRLELLGNHTDYNDGLVLALAVDRYLTISASPRSDGKVELVSSLFPEPVIFPANNLLKGPAGTWTNYVKGVLDQLRQHGVALRGFSAAIHSSIPLGAGLSSSAALEVATALIYRQLYPYTLTSTGCTVPPTPDASGTLPPLRKEAKLEIAKLCRAAENQFVGLQCGLLDQITCLFGKAFHAVEIDCQSLAVELVPMIGEVVFVVLDSGVQHQLVHNEYNLRRASCTAAAQAFGVQSLRALELKNLTAGRARLNDDQYGCARHILEEIRRVIFGTRALQEGDFTQFGQYMLQSHESSRDWFKNSCPELDCLVDIARAHPACYGARLTGGGFGGATINLVRQDQADVFMKSMAEQYEKRTGRQTHPMRCQVVDGAGPV
jgi:galactokinase